VNGHESRFVVEKRLARDFENRLLASKLKNQKINFAVACSSPIAQRIVGNGRFNFQALTLKL
jgi:hypothetical protein